MSYYQGKPITQLPNGFNVLPTDIYAAVDATAISQFTPTGVTKKYTISQLQSVIFGNSSWKNSVYAASPTNLTAVYNNGINGVGATLTNSGALAPIEIDGVSLAVGDRVLIPNQSSAYENGIYTVTTIGDSISVSWVLTRAVDYDGAYPGVIRPGDIVGVTYGTTAALTMWFQTAAPVVIGTDSIVFQEQIIQPSVNWVTQTTASATLQVNTGYTCDAGPSLITFTLPATSIAGDWIQIIGMATGLFTINQLTGQSIQFGTVSTTTGPGGSVTSTQASDAIKIICIVPNTAWAVVAVQGNLTYV